jgi:hypothetical protein
MNFEQELKDRDVILEDLKNHADSLTNSYNELKESAESRLEKLETEFLFLRDSSQSSINTDLHDQAIEENARLSERVKYLESQQYETDVIQNFLRGMDADNFHTVGIKLGFLEDTATDEDLEDLEGSGPIEVPLGEDQAVVISKDCPEDPENWEYSESQRLYVRMK